LSLGAALRKSRVNPCHKQDGDQCLPNADLHGSTPHKSTSRGCVYETTGSCSGTLHPVPCRRMRRLFCARFNACQPEQKHNVVFRRWATVVRPRPLPPLPLPWMACP
jgi:hypothetical protein